MFFTIIIRVKPSSRGSGVYCVCLRVEKTSLQDKVVLEAPFWCYLGTGFDGQPGKFQSYLGEAQSISEGSFTRLGPWLHYPTSEGTGVSLLAKTDILYLSCNTSSTA